MTVKQWIENFWYHYKIHTLITLLVVVTLVVGITQCASREVYDQNCILYCDRVISDNTAAALEQELIRYIGDTDGNGKIAFEVNNVSYDSDRTTTQDATFSNSQKLLALMSNADYVLYVVDAYGYDLLMTQNQLFQSFSFMPDQQQTAWNWKGSALQKRMKSYQLPDDLYFCIRKVSDTLIEQDEQAPARVEAAKTLVQKLMAE